MASSNMPVAEVDIDVAVVEELLAAQMPDLADRPTSLLAHGWDTVVFRLGDDLTVRLPRRAVVAEHIRHEQRWLARLAPALPLPVPVTLRLGRPQGSYPWHWSVCPWIPGVTADAEPPVDGAEDLGAFLTALHQPAPPDAPANPHRGIPLAGRGERFEEHLAALDGTGLDTTAVRRRWETALAVPAHAGRPVWLHGDLHPANLLVDDGRLSGVIDFIDLCAGDPATDLAVAWMLLDDPDRLRAVVGVGDDTWARAEGWALVFAVAILANSADHPSMAAIGQRTLRTLRLAQN